jgi:RNA polymerase sigma-70 factor (sigma-E family)
MQAVGVIRLDRDRAVLIPDTAPVHRPDEGVRLERLFAEHYASLVGLAQLLVDERESAEEIVQEAFVRFHTSLRRLRDPSRASAYLRRTVVNLARGQLRRRMTARAQQPAVSLEPLPDPTGAVAGRDAMIRALSRLPRRQRECLVLRYYLDLSEAEIAAALGIAVGTVKSHVFRGLDALRQSAGAL